MAQQEITSTTQLYLDIYDVTNDMVIMKDGTVSVLLTVDALNFGLLAEEEQDAIIYSYAGLLNSLNYSIQIVIKSVTKDVTGYLHLLQDQEAQATTRTRKDQIGRYRQFVTNLIQERNVLDKKFYIVIPATPIELGILSAQSVVPGVKTTAVADIDRSVILEKARNNLEPKRDHIIAQFGRIGLYARQLNTQEIIQLFYVSYNPEAAEGQQLTDSRNYTTPAVEARVQGVNMPDQTTPATTPTNQPATGANSPMPDQTGATAGSAPAAETPVMTPPAAGSTSETSGPSPDDIVAAVTTPQPEMPPATPSVTPVDGAGTNVQAEINNTLSQIGGTGAATPAPATTPMTPSTTPVGSEPTGQSMGENPGGTSVPPSQPTPTTPNSAGNSEALPEI